MAEDYLPIEEKFSLLKGMSENPVLLICLLEKNMIYDIWIINTLVHKDTAHIHSMWRSRWILEYTSIRYETSVKTLCNLFSNKILVHSIKYHFTSTWTVRLNIIYISKWIIWKMVINTECFLCIFKISTSWTESIYIAAIYNDKEVKRFLGTTRFFNTIAILKEWKNRWYLLKKYM